MSDKTYTSRRNKDAWPKVIKENPEFKGLPLPGEGRIIKGRKHATARYQDEEDKNGAVNWIHVIVVGTFSIALLVVFLY